MLPEHVDWDALLSLSDPEAGASSDLSERIKEMQAKSSKDAAASAFLAANRRKVCAAFRHWLGPDFRTPKPITDRRLSRKLVELESVMPSASLAFKPNECIPESSVKATRGG